MASFINDWFSQLRVQLTVVVFEVAFAAFFTGMILALLWLKSRWEKHRKQSQRLTKLAKSAELSAGIAEAVPSSAERRGQKVDQRRQRQRCKEILAESQAKLPSQLDPHMSDIANCQQLAWQQSQINNLSKNVTALERGGNASWAADPIDVEAANQLAHAVGTVFAYNTLLRVYTFIKDKEAAWGVVPKMQKAGLSPNHISYNILINFSAKSGDLEEAWHSMEQRISRGFGVDAYTLAIILKAVTSHGSGKDLREVFRLMAEFQIDANSDRILFCGLVEACLKHEFHKEMEHVLNTSTLQLEELPPHALVVLIHGWEKLDNLDKCLSVFDTIINKQSRSPRHQEFVLMIDMLVRHGLEDIAVEFGKKMSAISGRTVSYPKTKVG
jgi:pentatricopeptide repeat protein